MTAELERQLRRIESSEGFRGSPQLQRLLRFLTNQPLETMPSQYLIATEALGRPESFDPDSDPIVRVEMRRLRQRIDEYYAARPDDGLRIRFPRSSYTPVVEPLQARLPRIAVLPLHYTTEGDSFAIGAELADDIIHELGRSPAVAPLARTSVFALHARGRTAEEISRETGADWILEGSVRKSGDKYRFRASLIRCGSMTFAWNRDFACSPTGLPGLPDLIAAAVLATIAPGTSPRQEVRLPGGAAHMLYLKGSAAYNQGRTESVRQSLDLFRDAIREDPLYVRPRVALQDALLLPFSIGLEFPGAQEQAIALAADCQVLEPDSADALLAAGNAKLGCEGNWAGAAADYRRAIDLEPHNVSAYLWYTPYLGICGDLDGAWRMTRFAMSLDPLSPVVHHRLGMSAVAAGHLSEGVELYEEGIRHYPDYPANYIHQIPPLAFLGRIAIALKRADQVEAMAGANPMITAMRGFALARGGRRDEALAIAARLDTAAEQRTISPLLAAFIHSGLEDTEAAASRLNTAIGRGSCWMLPLLASPLLETLHRWDGLPAILARVNCPVPLQPMLTT